MPPAFALSQDQTLRFITLEAFSFELNEQDPVSHSRPASLEASYLTSVSVTHKRYTSQTRPIKLLPRRSNKISTQFLSPKPKPNLVSRLRAQQRRTPPTYPFLAYSNVKEPKRKTARYPHSVGQQA